MISSTFVTLFSTTILRSFDFDSFEPKGGRRSDLADFCVCLGLCLKQQDLITLDLSAAN